MPTSEPAARRFFTRYASNYSSNPSFASGSDLDALLAALKPLTTDVALDVGTGTGFTAFALARHTKRVVGVDITEEMLHQSKRLARECHVKNAVFDLGDAMKLRYPNASFNIVTTRRAAHHFDDVPAFLDESRRVLRPGGRLGVVDMSPPRAAVGFSNEIEKIRDSSHVCAYDPGEWRVMLKEAGFGVSSLSVLGEPIAFEDWLYPVAGGGKEEAAIRAAWKSTSPRVKKLLKADIRDGAVRGWTKQRIIIVASPKTP